MLDANVEARRISYKLGAATAALSQSKSRFPNGKKRSQKMFRQNKAAGNPRSAEKMAETLSCFWLRTEAATMVFRKSARRETLNSAQLMGRGLEDWHKSSSDSEPVLMGETLQRPLLRTPNVAHVFTATYVQEFKAPAPHNALGSLDD